jgi:hypothetical protein
MSKPLLSPIPPLDRANPGTVLKVCKIRLVVATHHSNTFAIIFIDLGAVLGIGVPDQVIPKSMNEYVGHHKEVEAISDLRKCLVLTASNGCRGGTWLIRNRVS